MSSTAWKVQKKLLCPEENNFTTLDESNRTHTSVPNENANDFKEKSSELRIPMQPRRNMKKCKVKKLYDRLKKVACDSSKELNEKQTMAL